MDNMRGKAKDGMGTDTQRKKREQTKMKTIVAQKVMGMARTNGTPMLNSMKGGKYQKSNN